MERWIEQRKDEVVNTMIHLIDFYTLVVIGPMGCVCSTMGILSMKRYAWVVSIVYCASMVLEEMIVLTIYFVNNVIRDNCVQCVEHAKSQVCIHALMVT